MVLVKGAPRVVSVEGEVKTPGVFEVQQGYTLISALAMAGSPLETARQDEVLIFRQKGWATRGRPIQSDRHPLGQLARSRGSCRATSSSSGTIAFAAPISISSRPRRSSAHFKILKWQRSYTITSEDQSAVSGRRVRL